MSQDMSADTQAIPGSPPDAALAGPRTGRRRALAGVVVVAAIVLGFVVGVAVRPGSDPELAGPVDAGFARAMSAHHSQAVQMSILVMDRTDDPDVRRLALDVVLTQQQQVGQMYAWLTLWGLPQSSREPVMGWMQPTHTSAMGTDHAADGEQDDAMPGMATQSELNELAAAFGLDAERRYLELMIPHHQGGVEMAEFAAANAGEPAVRQLAVKIATAQTAELTVLQDMLDERTTPRSE